MHCVVVSPKARAFDPIRLRHIQLRRAKARIHTHLGPYHRRHHHQEHHDQDVRRHQRVPQVKHRVIAGRSAEQMLDAGENLDAGMGEFVPHHARDRAADDARADREMREYLTRFHLVGATKLDYLADMKGLNDNSGLLMVVSSCFVDCRWELLKEAQRLLKNCICLNEGSLVLEGGVVIRRPEAMSH